MRHEEATLLMRVGVKIVCTVCGQMKQPVGRSAPMGPSYCTDDGCRGYPMPPEPGSLWPGETEVEFGYPVAAAGTIEMRRHGDAIFIVKDH